MSDNAHNSRDITKKFMIWNARHPVPLVMLGCLLAGAVMCCLPTVPHQRGAAWGWMGGALVLLAVWGCLMLRKRLPAWGHGVFWWGIGCCLRMRQILWFPYWQMQHDVGDFSMNDHHAGYILHFYNGAVCRTSMCGRCGSSTIRRCTICCARSGCI